MAAILTPGSGPRRRDEPTTPTRCTACGSAFDCGVATPGCWCSRMPPLRRLPADPAAGCLCPHCLAEAIARERRAGPERPDAAAG